MAYGLRQVAKEGDGYNTSGFSEMRIADGYNTAIFNGDCCELSSGNVIVSSGVPQGDDSADATIGFLVGCRYIDGNGDIKYAQYYKADTLTTDVYAYIVTDPNALIMVKGTSAWAQDQIGVQNQLVVGTGSATTGNSGWGVTNSSSADTAGGVFIRGVIKNGSNELASNSTPDLLVSFAPLASVWNS
jgi:hypothetical protein